jgi:DNA-binding response OmpR family regulator
MTTVRHKTGDGLRPKKVLIVDDDDEVARTLQSMVERHGFAAARAENGAVALSKLQTERPDVILLDIVMPVMDGFQLLSVLRKMPEAQAIPVIILSVRSDDATVSAAWQGGATLYLPKPFSSRELITVLRRVVAVAEELQEAQTEELTGAKAS